MLHPELPGPGDKIVDFPEGKVGVYTRFFEFANFCLPLSQFLFDVLGYYQIHLSQLSVIGAAKVSHFEINCHILNIILTLSLFRVFYTPSFNSGWMSFSKRLGKNIPQCYTKPLDSLKNWNNRFFWVDERVFPTVMDWRTNAPKDGMPAASTYSVEAVRALDTYRTPIQKQPEMLLCLVGISRRYYLGDEVYLTFLHENDRDMDLFSLIRAPNPTKVKVGSRPRAPHEVPLLTLTANLVIEMDDPATATDSSGMPPTIERSPLDFSLEAGASDQGTAALEVSPSGDVSAATAPEPSQVRVATADPPAATESRKRGPDGTDANAPPKSLRRDHADPRPSGRSHGGKSLAAIQLGLASTASMPEDAPTGVSGPDLLFFTDPPACPSADVAQSSPCIAGAGDPKSENASSPAEVGSSGGVYRLEWGVTNGSLLDTPEACQDLVDHVAPPPYFSELRHMHNEDLLGRYNVNLARQVAIGSQLRLRFEQDAKLLKKSVAQVARRDKRIQAREMEIKNMEARARFLDLQVSHEHLSQQFASLKEQISGEEKQKAAFEEFKRYEDDRVERRCMELDARLDALSIDFDEELYPHMLTAIAGRRWVIGHGLRLAAMKCGESLDMRQAFADVVSARITKEAEAKFVASLQVLKYLKDPLLDQLEGLKDAPIDVIVAALYQESDTGEDAPQCIRDLRPSSSQLTIPVYPEVHDPRNPWACKEEIVLADAIAANISHAEKKKKCRIVCRTHWVGSAHHDMSDGIPVSAPTVVPQGLALLLADAATQTEFDDR
uniref:Transposase (Putative), gypsy type n=1 Tax=Tanacetum cinerariifolium TaxID=118510 RepID=A0A6L2NB76_TANCI|nr:transposase (putative), gypsy type [Tanacetum cinerariifolium]